MATFVRFVIPGVAALATQIACVSQDDGKDMDRAKLDRDNLINSTYATLHGICDGIRKGSGERKHEIAIQCDQWTKMSKQELGAVMYHKRRGSDFVLFMNRSSTVANMLRVVQGHNSPSTPQNAGKSKIFDDVLRKAYSAALLRNTTELDAHMGQLRSSGLDDLRAEALETYLREICNLKGRIK